ncbi:MAG: hypothetical protein JWR16_862 [Nevskia sp.]|nr:hypothetical protein [Nevskia sp.]
MIPRPSVQASKRGSDMRQAGSALYAERVQDELRRMLGGSALSIALHLLLAAAVLFYWPHRDGKSGTRSQRYDRMIISLDRGPPKPLPPQATKLPEPVPAPSTPSAKPRAESKPKPAAPAQSASASKDDTQKTKVEIDPDAENEALLEGVRARWLQPPNTRRDFRCRIRIDYQLGGMISGVTVQEGCGGPLLDDSVERAIWKAQPLPIAAARTQSGNLTLEFTP